MAFTLAVALLCLSLIAPSLGSGVVNNRTYTNPVLPGWNSDPSCVFLPEWNDTAFCTTSTFLVFPGIPVFASKDLTTWRLASNALSRPEQLPELSTDNGDQQDGIFASTLRYRDGVFYLITSFVSRTGGIPLILLFTTTDPYADAAWGTPLRVENPGESIDPDIFWDAGKVYMAAAGGTYITEIDTETGTAGETFTVWNGTDRNPEGPHLYRKDGYYYLLIAEGGTETNHTVSIARSKDIRGPYEPAPNNPVLTAKNTDNYFQTVGHADFFQDSNENWWSVALATRSGPEWEIYPMGRETVLVPMRWEEGEWPVVDSVFGEMSGPLPAVSTDIPGDGHFATAPDEIDFVPGSTIPRHFAFWRPSKTSLFEISPEGHPNSLRITSSKYNLTADSTYQPGVDDYAFVGRKQTASTFNYSVDLSFAPEAADEEAGITVFLTQYQHMDLGIIGISSENDDGSVVPQLRFRVEASGKPNTTTAPETATVPIDESWLEGPIRLQVEATSDLQYEFSAMPASNPEKSVGLGSASAAIVSGGTGPFTGTIMGSYATTNGGDGTTPAYFSRWRYTPITQQVDEDKFVPA